MDLIVKKVSFNNQDFVELESEETWAFSNYSITTPNGFIKIDDCTRVENEQFVGVELSIWKSTLRLFRYDGYEGDNGTPEIETVAFVRHPHNVWLWVYLMDEAGETIAVFCGHEKNFDDEFAKYVEELDEVDYFSCAHLQAEKYKIMEINGDCQHSKYGDMDIVRANPIENNGFSESYVTHFYEETEDFFVKDKNLINRLFKLGQGDGVWVPNPDDYEDEICLDENTGERKSVHLHKSLIDNDYDGNGDYGIPEETPSELMTRLIPDIMSKKNGLESQWKSGGWYYTYPNLRDYVRSLGTDDDVVDFFGWLFNDQRFHGCKEWELPYEYLTAYNKFLKLFFSLDD